MNIKLDENLPERLVLALSALGHDVDTVRSEQLAGRDDADVWSGAQSAGRFLITQDLDFSDVRRESGGVRALVMELVEGEDLSQRIARGAIPLDDALARRKKAHARHRRCSHRDRRGDDVGSQRHRGRCV